MQQLNEHKEHKLRDHYRKERMKSSENVQKSYKHNYTTNQNQIRQDYYCDHSWEDRESPSNHEHHAQYLFSKKCFNVNYHPAQNEKVSSNIEVIFFFLISNTLTNGSGNTSRN